MSPNLQSNTLPRALNTMRFYAEQKAARAATMASAIAQDGLRANSIFGSLSVPSNPLTWEALESAARIVLTPDGRPIRTIITGHKHIVTGSYASRKAGRAFPHEGMNEQSFFMHSEVDPRVVSYRAQPFRVEVVINSEKRVYIADCARLLQNGRIEVVEVKNDQRSLRDIDYASKLEAVKEACFRLGWAFRVVTRWDLENPPIRWANIRAVQSRRMTRFEDDDVRKVLQGIDREGEATLADLADRLGDPRVGRAMIQAMMVGRIVVIDLDVPLGPESTVRRISGLTASPKAGGAR